MDTPHQGPTDGNSGYSSTVFDETDGERYERFTTALDQAYCVIEMIFDSADHPVDYRFLETNPAFESQTGLVDVIGRTVTELVPGHEPHWFEIYGRIARTGIPEKFVNEASKLGRWFDVFAFPAGRDRVAVLFTDITARRQAERALRQSEERLRVALNAARMGAWTYEVCSGATHQSARYQELFGREPDDIAATIEEVYARIHPDDRDTVRESIGAALRGERAYQTEYRAIRPDGRTVWIHSEGEVTRNAAGEAVRVSGVAYDVTERRTTEEALREADRRKNEFLAVLAHELRNPLAPIRNSLEIMRRATHDPQMLRGLHDTMERQLGQMIRLVDDLLDISRISHGRIALEMRRVDLAKVLLGAVEASRPLIEAAHHKMHVTLPPEPVWVTGDPARLTQVFLNLLNNGAKYTAPGGSLWLSAERDGDVVSVRVRDTGIGIAPGQLESIFDMFAQVAAASPRSQGGLGIGLTLVRQLVELHGGRVRAHSDGANTGSEFVVSLPVATVQGASDAPVTGEHDVVAPRGGRRVLVVDDSRDGAESLAALLRLTGHQVAVAHDGVAAIATFGSFRPDVVLMDLGMPRMNGYDAAKRIRELDGGDDVTLVAVTGWGQESDKQSTAAGGFDAHLTKPVDFAVLGNLLLRTRR